MQDRLKKCIQLLEKVTGKKVMLEFIDDREDNLFTKSANKVSETIDILTADMQQLVSQIDEHPDMEEFSVEASVFLDQIAEFQNRVSQSIVTANEDKDETPDLEEADMIGQQNKGAIRVTTDQFSKNMDGKLKPILAKDMDVELTDLN